MNIDQHRRQFLRRGFALGTFGLANVLPGFGLSAASAQLTDYKALVCVFLFGGNDGNNTFIPIGAGYAGYNAIRNTASGINLPEFQADGVTRNILPLSSTLGIHPSMPEMQALFAAGKMGVVCNVGPLTQPLTRTQYLASSKVRPDNLFSHSDRLVAANNGAAVPMSLSFAGSQMFGNGVSTFPLALPQSGGFTMAGTGSTGAALARKTALQTINNTDDTGPLMDAASNIFGAALSSSDTLNPILTQNPIPTALSPFNGLTTSVANQLRQVARIINARATLGHNRDVFIVSQGGFDTHNGQLTTQAQLLDDLSAALNAFYYSTVNMSLSDKVTAFTMSDFGRTFKPATGAPPGSDHAWGNHHMVLGGAVKGNATYGNFPVLGLGSADDSGSEGRWIPQISIEQYGSTLASWFGASTSDLDYIFPNRGLFGAGPAFL